MDDAHPAEGRELVAVVQLDIYPGGARVVSEQVGFADPREQRVDERIGQRLGAFDVGRLGEMYAGARGHVFLKFGQTADVVDMKMRDEDVADFFGRTTEFLERGKDACAGAGAARVDQCDLVFDDQVGAGALRAYLVEAGKDLLQVAKGRRLHLFPAVLPGRASLRVTSRHRLRITGTPEYAAAARSQRRPMRLRSGAFVAAGRADGQSG